MSPGLDAAATDDELYLHRPVDDAFSFFFVALWITLMHPKARGTTSKEENWRITLRVNKSRPSIIETFEDLLKKPKGKEKERLSPLIQSMMGLLIEWYHGLRTLNQEMDDDLEGSDPVHRIQLLCFDRFAYRSVNLFVDLLIKHRKDISTTPFPG